jgi:hypothetical protein
VPLPTFGQPLALAPNNRLASWLGFAALLRMLSRIMGAANGRSTAQAIDTCFVPTNSYAVVDSGSEHNRSADVRFIENRGTRRRSGN